MSDGPKTSFEIVDLDGKVVTGDVQLDDAAPTLFELTAPKVEVALWECLYQTQGFIGGLAAMMQMADPKLSGQKNAHKQFDPDLCDNAVALCLNSANIAMQRCATVPEKSIDLLSARSVLNSYVDGLRRVNVAVDSAPAVALARVWMAVTHTLLHPKATNAEKRDALTHWQERRKRILTKGR